MSACHSGKPAVREMEAQVHDATLHVRVAGNPDSGNVLIAIHGGPGMSSDYMINLEQLAGPELAVVTYDQRGVGRSTSPPGDASNYSLLKYVEDLESVRQVVGAESVHLLGHSWGGVVALRYVTVHPQRVRSLVLMGSGAPGAEAMRAAQANKAQRVVALQQQGLIPNRPTSVRDILPAYFSDPRFEMPDELQNLYYNGTVEQLTWSAIGDYDFSAEVARLDHLVLVLWGADDPFGRQMAEATVSALSNAAVEFVVLEKCGHFWHECPAQFYSRVRAFLEVVSTTTAAAARHEPTATPTIITDVSATNSGDKETDMNDYLGYFDFGGLDWNAVHERYQPLIAAAQDDETFYELINKMLFELNVSHVAVVPPDDLQQIEPILSAEGSIGMDLRLLDGVAVITAVKPGSPADQAGLRPGFVVQRIGGQTVEQIARETRLIPPLNDRNQRKRITASILERAYGPADTMVSIAYLDERGEAHETAIRRTQRDGRVALADGLPPFFIEFEARRLDDDIGYIRFNAFLPPVNQRFPEALESLRDARGLIIDLRGNHGGFFEVRKALAEQLVQERRLFWSYQRRDSTREVYLEPAENAYAGPLVVLIDVMSISSAEEFSGAMQAIGRAAIVGEQSAGVVVAADWMQLPNGATFMYPIEQTRTADGTVLEGRGVIPDIEVALDRALLLQGRDSQLEAALRYLQSAMQD
jgi:C-terminal peptidase prc